MAGLTDTKQKTLHKPRSSLSGLLRFSRTTTGCSDVTHSRTQAQRAGSGRTKARTAGKGAILAAVVASGPHHTGRGKATSSAEDTNQDEDKTTVFQRLKEACGLKRGSFSADRPLKQTQSKKKNVFFQGSGTFTGEVLAIHHHSATSG